jgi:hypothetical protein
MDILQAIGYGDKVKAEHLNDFPENGIHRHLAILAAFCQASEVGKDRAEKLIEKKAAAAVLRRPLQANEIKDAVSNIYRGKTRNRGEGRRRVLVLHALRKVRLNRFVPRGSSLWV